MSVVVVHNQPENSAVLEAFRRGEADAVRIVPMQHLEGMTQSAIGQKLGVPLAALLEHLRGTPAH